MGKRLGQHFLINKDKLRKIVEILELKEKDVIIEIGPGHGELTREVVSGFRNLKIKNFKIIAIEKDAELWEGLASGGLKSEKNVEFVCGDALKIISNLIVNRRFLSSDYKIVGNIPYYITGYLLRILGELKKKQSLIVLTVQKEVAERLCAKEGEMNILAASVQFWARAKIVDYISKKDFQPAPKIDSAIIKLMPYEIIDYQRPIIDYYKFIKIIFKQPRKTILNNLKQITDNSQFLAEKLKASGVNSSFRPQDLSVKKIIELSTLF